MAQETLRGVGVVEGQIVRVVVEDEAARARLAGDQSAGVMVLSVLL